MKKRIIYSLVFVLVAGVIFFAGMHFTTIKRLVPIGIGRISSIVQKGQEPILLSSEFVSASISEDELNPFLEQEMDGHLIMDVKIKIRNTSLPDGIKTLYLVGCENIPNSEEDQKIYTRQGFVIDLEKLIPYNSEQEINFTGIPLFVGKVTCSYNEDGLRECYNKERNQLRTLTIKSCILLYSSNIDADRLWTLQFQFANKDSSIKNYGEPIKSFNNVHFNPETDVYEFVDINQVLEVN